MAIDFKTLIGVAFDKTQAQTELDRQIKSLQKSSKLALNIELSDKNAKKIIQDQSKMWSNYRKESVSAITASNTELQKMAKYYNNVEKEIQKNISAEKKLYIAENEAYKINEQMRQNVAKQTSKSSQSSFNLDINKNILSSNMSSFLRENSKLTDDFKNRIVNLQSQIKKADKIGLSQLQKEFRATSAEAKSLGLTGKNVFDQLKTNIGQFLNFFYGAGAVVGAINSVKSLVSTTVELDKAIVNLQVATGKTNAETKELIDTYIDMGQELGATGIEVANAAESYLKQGRSIAETNILIKDSIMLAKLGSIESADATKYLTTITKAYGISAQDTLSVVDKLSKVDLISANDVGGLSAALNEVSSNAQSLGVNLDELLGYVASIGEVSGEQMSAVGNSVNTMFSRMGNIKLKRLVDPTTGEDLSNTETSLRRVGIALREDNETFRDFSEVLTEVAGNWSGYNDVTKQSIAASIAGVDHINDFKILMTNFGKATEYTNASLNSSGAAMEKFSSYEEGVEAKTKILQASFQELATGTLDSQVIKSFLDVSNVLVQFAADTDLITTALEVFGVVALTKAVPAMISIVGGAVSYISTLGIMIAEEIAATGSTNILTGALTALNTVATMNPLGALIVGATALVLAIKGISAGFDYLNVTLEEQQEITQNLQTEYNDLQTRLSSVNDELKTTSDRINELNSKDNLTFIEQQELENLKETNRELETQNDLLQKQSEYKNKDLNNSIKSEFNKQYGEDSNPNHTISEAGMAWYDQGSWAGTESGYVDYLIERLGELNNLKEQGVGLTKDEGSEYDKISEYLTNAGVDYADFASRYTINDDTKKSWLDMAELINKTLNPAQYKTNSFDEVFNSDSFSKAKEELQSLANAGELTPETISSSKEYSQLLTDTGLTAKEVTDQIIAMADASNEIGSAPTVALKSYKDIIDDLSPKIKTVTSAQYELSESGYLNYDTVSDLLELYPELQSSLTATENGYTVTKGALDKLITSETEQYQLEFDNAVSAAEDVFGAEFTKQDGYDGTAESLKKLTQAKINDAKATLAQVQADYTALGIGGGGLKDFAPFTDALSQLTELEASLKSVENAQSNLDASKTVSIQIKKDTTNTLTEKGKKKSDDPNLEAYQDDKEKLDFLHDTGKKSDTKYYAELLGLKNKYLTDTKKYQSEIFAVEKSIYDYNQELADKAKQDAEDAIKSKFGANEDDFNLGLKTEEEYYTDLENLNETYYKDDIDNQSEYLANKEKLYSHSSEKIISSIESIIDANKNAISDSQDEISNYTNGSDAQFNAINKGLKEAKNAIIDYKNEIENLTKMYNNHKITFEDYIDQLDNLNSAIDDTTKSQENLNNSLLNFPVSQLENINEELQSTLDSLNKTKDSYNSVIGAVTGVLDGEINAINKQKESSESFFDGLIKNKQAELDLLQNTNSEREKQQKLEQSLYDLERAKNQKSNKVFKSGQGFVYEADTNAIREAQSTLDNLAFDKIITTKEDEIDALEKAKNSSLESYDLQIERISKIKDMWSEIANTSEKLASINLADSLFGKDWQSSVISGDMKDFNMMETLYGSVESQITNIEDQIKRNELSIKSITDTVEAWQNGEINITTALSNIQIAQDAAKDNEALTLDTRLKKMQGFADEYTSLAKICAEALGSIEADLTTAKAKRAELDSLTNHITSSSKDSQIKTVGKSHSGMELGYIGENSSNNSKDMFRAITLDKLKPDEMLRILKFKEGVVTELQQYNAVDNMFSAFKAGTMTNFANFTPKNNIQPVYSIGEIKLYGVNDVDSFASAISSSFLPTLNQKLYK